MEHVFAAVFIVDGSCCEDDQAASAETLSSATTSSAMRWAGLLNLAVAAVAMAQEQGA